MQGLISHAGSASLVLHSFSFPSFVLDRMVRCVVQYKCAVNFTLSFFFQLEVDIQQSKLKVPTVSEYSIAPSRLVVLWVPH